MKKRDEAAGLFDALAESVLSSSDEELSGDIRDGGEDPDSVAYETRALLMKTLKDFRQRPLTKARSEHQSAVARLTSARPKLPDDLQERRNLLVGVLTNQPAARGVLTAQWRDFGEMTDDDVETALIELIHLEFIKPDTSK